MVRLPRKLLLAMEAVVDIAYNARPEPVQSKQITERQGVPLRYLEPVMQQLVRAGVLKGVRGPHGGYTLARERRRITLGDVARVVELGDDETAGEETASGSELGRKVVRPVWQDVENELMIKLDAITLEDLCARARALGVRHAGRDNEDFAI